MYETAFRLQKRPFSATPDATCFHAPEPLQEILAQLLHCLEESQGIAVLTGAAGTGKTLICRRMVQELSGRMTVAYLSSASFASRRALLQAILYEVGQRYAGLGEQELRLELKSFLKGMVSAGKALALIIDEAHLLNERLLEEVRLLANASEAGQSPVRVMLAGQLALEETLAAGSQGALSQLIASQACLETLTHSQSLEYLDYRIAWAAGDARQLFADDAREAIARASGGVPRCLNQLADHSLLLAFVHESARVEPSHVADALADLKQLPLHWNEPLSQSLSSEAAMPAATLDPPAGELTGPIVDAFSVEIGGESSQFEAPYQGEPEAPASGVTHRVPLEAIVRSSAPQSYDPAGSLDMGWASAGGIVPLTAGSRKPVTLVEEEVVIDRYAQLDSGLDEPQPMPAKRGGQAVAMSPEPDDDDEIRVCPDQFLEDDVIPLLEDAIGEDARPSSDDFELPIFHAETTPREEQVEADVFDICMEVQQSILDRLSPLSFEGPIDPDPSVEYDAVEPEVGSRPSVVPQRVQHIDPPAQAETTVPPPNYKLIFSTLRKKLGKSRKLS